jgi:restriction system-associated AAA family ATPase
LRLLNFTYFNRSHAHPLNGIEYDFREYELLEEELNPLCLVGINGSGKSKLLECLAHTFGYLFNLYSNLYSRSVYDTQIEFKLRYALKRNKQWIYVEIERTSFFESPQIRHGSDQENLKMAKGDVLRFLPKSVIGYTSGENESLSDWFSSYRDQYAEYYMSTALGRKTKIVLPAFPHMVWIDYSMNRLVFIANALLGKDKDWGQIEDEVNLRGLRSFRITIRLKPKDGPSKGIIPAKEQKAIIELLRNCCTTSQEVDKDQLLILDFYVNEITRNVFKDKFKSAYNLYISLLQLELLNHVVVRGQLEEMRRFERDLNERIDRPDILSTRRAFNISQVKVFVKGSIEVIDYGDLSDGEHQLMQVFGTLAMAADENSIFLMDEPETHFNPQWRAAFISLMTKIVGKRCQEYLITTHSPFLLSDSKSENVFIFEKNNGKINITQPEIQTYGTAIERLLKVAFNVAPPVAAKSSADLENLLNSKKDPETLEHEALRFGDSIQKLYLYQKIQALKSDDPE